MVRAPFIDVDGMKKGAWSQDEDEKLKAYIQRFGNRKVWSWRLVPKYAGLARNGKSCRLRWVNYLKPGLKKGNFSKFEEDLIVEMHSQLGNKWSLISLNLPGRTDNEIKNFWNGHVVKRPTKNSAAKTNNKGHAYNDRQARRANQVIEKQSPREMIAQTKTTQNVPISLDPVKVLESSAQCFQTSSSDFWTDPFLLDMDSYTENDYRLPQFSEEEFMFTDYGISDLKSSDSPYLSSLDWIADDDHSVISFDHSIPNNAALGIFSTELLGSSSENGNSYMSPQVSSGHYDPFFQYFDNDLGLF